MRPLFRVLALALALTSVVGGAAAHAANIVGLSIVGDDFQDRFELPN